MISTGSSCTFNAHLQRKLSSTCSSLYLLMEKILSLPPALLHLSWSPTTAVYDKMSGNRVAPMNSCHPAQHFNCAPDHSAGLNCSVVTFHYLGFKVTFGLLLQKEVLFLFQTQERKCPNENIQRHSKPKTLDQRLLSSTH